MSQQHQEGIEQNAKDYPDHQTVATNDASVRHNKPPTNETQRNKWEKTKANKAKGLSQRPVAGLWIGGALLAEKLHSKHPQCAQ